MKDKIDNRAETWRKHARYFGMATFLLALNLSGLSASAEEASVKINNFVFSPEVLTVKAGTTVVFYNEDDILHSVVAESREFRSKALDTEEKFTFTFTKPGTIDYFCGLHPHMKGKIVVIP
jgi:plastocyanin